MDPESLRRAESLFAAARKLTQEQWRPFLHANCGDNLVLAEFVYALLEADLGPGPLDATAPLSRLPVNYVINGRFRILRFVDEGGMGAVYEAEDLLLREHVALKLIRSDLASDSRAIERFEREVKLAKKVTHPTVCRVHDLGVEKLPDGTELRFLTMQFLSGETLSARLRRGRIGEEEAASLIEDLADALTAAHQVGVIHRDFKSGNVILVGGLERVRAVVTDFGLARSIDGENLSTGAIVGTVAYMAPEQIRGEVLTPATDIYALGVVMYEMLTGQRPFYGDTDLSIALKHLNDEPKPLRTHVPGLGRKWDEVVLRCLKKLPQDRFASAAEVMAAISGGKIRRRPTAELPIYSRVLGYLAMAVCVASLWPPTPKAPLLTPTQERSVAVLPFRQSADTPEAFSFGFTEELMNALGEVPGIRLIGPESSSHFKETDLSPTEIGQRLAANYLLMGTVYRLNHQVRAVVRVVETKGGSQVWSRDLSKDEKDVLLLPDEIARGLSRALDIDLSTPPPRKQIDASGLRARDLYWTGRFKFHQRNSQAVAESLQYFRDAVKQEPGFAEAHCGIADALSVLAERGLVPPEKALAEAGNEARRAVALNNRLPEAYVSLGQVTSIFDRDLDGAERLFRRALDLNPRLEPAWQWLSYQLAKQRRFPEAIKAAVSALDADPLSTAANINLAVVYFYAGSFDYAVQQARKLAQMDSNLFVDHIVVSEVFAAKGLYSEAIHELAIVPDASQSDPIIMRVWVEIYAMAGMRQDALAALARLRSRFIQGGVPPSYLAVAYAAVGDRNNALSWLERAWTARDAFASSANVYPAFAGLRSDPRWTPLMVRFGFKAAEASDLSPPAAGGKATSRVSPGPRKAFLEPGICEDFLTQEQRCAPRGLPVPGGSDPRAERPGSTSWRNQLDSAEGL